jgi:hypothetical protein
MRLISSFLALALSTSAALAGDVGPLAPGVPAGVKHAQESGNIVLYGLLGAGAVAGFVVALTSGSNSGSAPAASSATSIASTV